MSKAILITGSTDGIGKGTALNLADLGWNIFIHGRNIDRVEETVEIIKKTTGNTKIKGIVGDFSSLKEVEKMCEDILVSTDRLDVLLNNAGVLMKSFELSADGYEMTFAVNHLAHFYLTGRLLPILLDSDGARIINVSFGIHSGKIILDSLMLHEKFESVKNYSDSKLCNILFSNKLAKLLEDKNITINSMHPGVINTKMLKETWGPVGSELNEGVKREMFLINSEKLNGVSGKYVDSFRIVSPSDASNEASLQNELWKLSLELLRRSGMRNPFTYYL